MGGETNTSYLIAIVNLTLEKVKYGKIRFLEITDLSQDIEGGVINFTKYVNISRNRIEVNSSGLAGLDTNAKLKLYNITFTDPQILREGEVCSDCVEESYINNTLTFNVTGFSVYSARETPVTTAPTGGNNNGGSGGGGSSYECDKMSDCESGYNCYEHKCVKLFDVEILSLNPIINSLNFSFEYLIKGMAEFEGDVIINFWVERNGEKIELGQDVVYFGSFEEKTKKTNLIFPYYIGNGDYKLYVQAEFENYKAQSFRNLNLDISDEEKEIAKQEIGGLSEIAGSKAYLWILLLFVFLVAIIIILNLLIKLKRLGLSEMKFRAKERMYWAKQRMKKTKERFKGFGKKSKREGEIMSSLNEEKSRRIAPKVTQILADPYQGVDGEYKLKKTSADPYNDADAVYGVQKSPIDLYKEAERYEVKKTPSDPYLDADGLEESIKDKEKSPEFKKGMNDIMQGVGAVKQGLGEVGQRMGQKLGAGIGKITGYFERIWEKEGDISSNYLKKISREKERGFVAEKRIKESKIVEKRIRTERLNKVWNQMEQNQVFGKRLEPIKKIEKKREDTPSPLKLKEKETQMKFPPFTESIGKKVYDSSGNKIGYIKNVIFEKNRISGWAIKLDKRQGFRKSILVKSEDVNHMNGNFIIDEAVENYLDKIKEKKKHIDLWKGHEIDENKRYRWRFWKNHWERKDK